MTPSDVNVVFAENGLSFDSIHEFWRLVVTYHMAADDGTIPAVLVNDWIGH